MYKTCQGTLPDTISLTISGVAACDFGCITFGSIPTQVFYKITTLSANGTYTLTNTGGNQWTGSGGTIEYEVYPLEDCDGVATPHTETLQWNVVCTDGSLVLGVAGSGDGTGPITFTIFSGEGSPFTTIDNIPCVLIGGGTALVE